VLWLVIYYFVGSVDYYKHTGVRTNATQMPSPSGWSITPRTSANGMNHTCLFLPSQSWYSFTPERWKAELALGGWLVTYRNKCPAPGTEPGHDRPSSGRGEGRLSGGSVLGDVSGSTCLGGVCPTFEHITARPLLSSKSLGCNTDISR